MRRLLPPSPRRVERLIVLGAVYVQAALFPYYWEDWSLLKARSVVLVLGLAFAASRAAYFSALFLIAVPLIFRVAAYWVNLLYFSWFHAVAVLLLGALFHKAHEEGAGRPRGLKIGIGAFSLLFAFLGTDHADSITMLILVAAVLTGVALLAMDRLKPRRWERWAGVFLLFALMTQAQFYLFKFQAKDILGAKLARQEGVTRLFGPGERGIPGNPMALYDLGHKQRLAVLPHKPSHHIAIFENGRVVDRVELGTEAANVSVLVEGRLYTDSAGALVSLDVDSLELQRQMRVAQVSRDRNAQVGYIYHDKTRNRLYAFDYDGCNIISLDDYRIVKRLPAWRIGVCLPLAGGREIMLSTLHWKGRRISIYDAEDFHLKRSKSYFDLGIADAAYDPQSNTIYAPSMSLGILRAIDAESLEVKGWVLLRPGMWSVLVDPKRPYLYSWNYFTGVVRVLDKTSMKPLRKIHLGPNLRVISFSIDGDALLAVTKAGGFRVSL